jgi:hypothetical protein
MSTVVLRANSPTVAIIEGQYRVFPGMTIIRTDSWCFKRVISCATDVIPHETLTEEFFWNTSLEW